jgi:hypothetical protein
MDWHRVPNDQNTNRHRRPFYPSFFQHSWIRPRYRHPDSRCCHHNVGMCKCYTFYASRTTLLIRPFVLTSPTMLSVASNCATWRCMVSTTLATSCLVALGVRCSQWHFSCVRGPLPYIRSKTMCSRADFGNHRLGVRLRIGHPEHLHRAKCRFQPCYLHSRIRGSGGSGYLRVVVHSDALKNELARCRRCH